MDDGSTIDEIIDKQVYKIRKESILDKSFERFKPFNFRGKDKPCKV